MQGVFVSIKDQRFDYCLGIYGLFLRFEMKDQANPNCSFDFTETFDACQGICDCVLFVFRGRQEDAYQTRWHTFDQAWHLFSFHCHMEDRWESNLRRKKMGYGTRSKTSNAAVVWS